LFLVVWKVDEMFGKMLKNKPTFTTSSCECDVTAFTVDVGGNSLLGHL
jgi:hypothetical protein